MASLPSGDRTPEIMRLAREIAALAAGTNRRTARGIIQTIGELALSIYDICCKGAAKEESA